MTTLKELRERARELGIKGASKMNTEAVTAAIEAETGGPIEVAGSNGRNVTVARSGDEVVVTWLCGGKRRFTTEDLATALERFTTCGEGLELWYEDDDSRGQYWAAVLQDGNFHGDDRVNGASGHVPWPEFKAALQASLTTLE